MKYILEQGGFKLQQIVAIPIKTVLLLGQDPKRMVLMQDKATGHSHVIYENADNVKVWVDNKFKYLEIMDVVVVTHKNHPPMVVEPGFYRLPD